MFLRGDLTKDVHIFKMTDGEKITIRGCKIIGNVGQFIVVKTSENHRIDIREDKVMYHETMSEKEYCERKGVHHEESN